MNLFDQPKFELSMWLIANAFRKLDPVINSQPGQIVAWQPISKYLTRQGDFANLIKAIDLTPLYKAEKENEIDKIPVVTDADINFIFWDKEWTNATVGELAERLPDLAGHIKSISSEANKAHMDRSFSRYYEQIAEQKLVQFKKQGF